MPRLQRTRGKTPPNQQNNLLHKILDQSFFLRRKHSLLNLFCFSPFIPMQPLHFCYHMLRPSVCGPV